MSVIIFNEHIHYQVLKSFTFTASLLLLLNDCNMPQTIIAGIGHYVPSNVVTNNDLLQYMETSDEWIQERTGIKERRYAHRTDETTTTMGVEAAKIAIERTGITN